MVFIENKHWLDKVVVAWIPCLVMFYGSELIVKYIIIFFGLYVLVPRHSYSSIITTTLFDQLNLEISYGSSLTKYIHGGHCC